MSSPDNKHIQRGSVFYSVAFDAMGLCLGRDAENRIRAVYVRRDGTMIDVGSVAPPDDDGKVWMRLFDEEPTQILSDCFAHLWLALDAAPEMVKESP